MPVKSFKLNSFPKLGGLVAVGFVCLILFYFFAKWCFAYEIAVHSQNRETAEFAVNLSPNEPQTHFALSVWQEKTFLPEDFAKSLAEIEKATALAPNDFRLWLALGKARERNGDIAGAEKALQKARTLAPNYSEVLWTLGNFYFRAGNTAEAFPLIRRAAETDKNFTAPAISIFWQIFDGDVLKIKNALGDSPQTDLALVLYLAKEKRLDEAAEIWHSLTEKEKNLEYQQIGDQLFAALIAEKKYRSARKVKNLPDETGKIFNGDFEQPLQQATTNVFDWQIGDGLKPAIGLNNETKHGGNASLFLFFNSDDGKDFRQIQQSATIVSGKSYEFDFFYKTELKTTATFRWEIVDAADGKVLTASEPILENSDWTSSKAMFTAPENTEVVIIRLARAECKQGICPVSGKVWFDDLTLR